MYTCHDVCLHLISLISGQVSVKLYKDDKCLSKITEIAGIFCLNDFWQKLLLLLAKMAIFYLVSFILLFSCLVFFYVSTMPAFLALSFVFGSLKFVDAVVYLK